VALAGAAAYLDPEACVPARPVSVLALHGDADTTVPYEGGMTSVDGAGEVLGAVASVERWSGYDGCGALEAGDGPLDVASNVPGAETTTRRATGCPDAVGVELWTIADADHIPPLRDPETADALWAWLDDHARE
jgi:polyhydroxybutyrate depolymerase